MRAVAPILLFSTLLAAQGPQSLKELAEVARQRAANQTEKQLEEFKPFLKDLDLDYSQHNRKYLSQRFALAARIGDSIVPMLLTKLKPWDPGDPVAINVAHNSARVLRNIGPAGFVTELIALVDEPDFTARRLAIQLLGHTESPRAARVIESKLEDLRGAVRIDAVDALRRLRSLDKAAMIAEYLFSQEQALRSAALSYLTETRAPKALPTVLEALSSESSSDLVGAYVAYLLGAAPQNAEAADALLRFVDPETHEIPLVTSVCRALTVIAPRGHAGTLAACNTILDGEDTGPLGLECTQTMKALGDPSGEEKLHSILKSKIRREPKVGLHYASRGDLYRAQADWDRAARDYWDAIERTTAPTMRRELHLLAALCEAERKHYSSVVKALRESGANYAKIMEMATRHPALARSLETPAVGKFMSSLPRPRNGR